MSVLTVTAAAERGPARGFSQALGALSAVEGFPSTLVVTAGADRLDPLDYLARFHDLPIVLWQQGEALHFGVGVAAEITARGRDRFAAVQSQARQVFDELAAAGETELPPFVGGFSFDADPSEDPAWAAFPPARFVLPAMTYSVTGNRSTVTAIVGRRPESLSYERVRELLLRALAPKAPAARARQVARVLSDTTDPSAQLRAWTALLTRALARIDAGALQKVVLARQCALRFEREPELASLLEALRAYCSQCCLFALRFEQAAFMGVTPECLVERRGLQVRSGALAGSVASSTTDPGKHLLSLDKERREHALVLDAIVERMRPFCSSLQFAPEPEPRVLRHITHLHTPVTGTLGEPHHVLELVQALHPTPAVGGTPQAAALDWLKRHEGTSRGWYAAPVGWFDCHGDGRFEVALRSTLVTGREARAYAGAGIVAGSDPAAEFQETELKLAAVVHALTTRAADLQADGDVTLD